MPIDVLYFAWVRERIGTGRESVEPPAAVQSVDALRAWLARRSPGHAAALDDGARIRAAVDDRFASPETPLAGAREISFFPPVTGG